MNKTKRMIALVSVLIKGEPFLFVIFMFLSVLGADVLAEQTGQKLSIWLTLALAVFSSSALMAAIYPRPVWWLALLRYLLSGGVSIYLVKFAFDDLIKPQSVITSIIGLGLMKIWSIVDGVNFPGVIFIGLFACILSVFWIAIVSIVLILLVMIILIVLFGLINTILLIWFKPIFDNYKTMEDEKNNSRLRPLGNKKSVALILCLIGLFFFVHGMHRIYTGRYLTGVVQLLTLGGLFIWTIADLILILSGNFGLGESENSSELIDTEIM
jgi:MFS family permease